MQLVRIQLNTSQFLPRRNRDEVFLDTLSHRRCPFFHEHLHGWRLRDVETPFQLEVPCWNDESVKARGCFSEELIAPGGSQDIVHYLKKVCYKSLESSNPRNHICNVKPTIHLGYRNLTCPHLYRPKIPNTLNYLTAAPSSQHPYCIIQ